MDQQLVERENTILGQDFLTWLWYTTEELSGTFTTDEGISFALYMEQKVSVQGGEGDGISTATVSNPHGQLTEALRGLRTGKKVSRAMLKLEVDGEEWQVQVKALDFALSGLKTPKMESQSDDEDPDGAFLEKIYLIERCLELLDVVYAQFLSIRLNREWITESQKVRDWIAKQ